MCNCLILDSSVVEWFMDAEKSPSLHLSSCLTPDSTFTHMSSSQQY